MPGRTHSPKPQQSAAPARRNSIHRRMAGWCARFAALAGICASPAAATDFTLTMEGIGDGALIGSFYSGLGVTMSSNVRARIDSDVYGGGTGNFANEPSSQTAMQVPSNAVGIVNVSGTFTNFTGYYSLTTNSGSYTVFSGFDGTGTVLASGNLPGLGFGPGDPSGSYSVWAVIDIALLPDARSIRFNAPSGGLYLDNLRFRIICNPTIPPVVSAYTTSLSANAGPNCTATVPDFRPFVTANDNCTPTNQLVITQVPAPGTLVGIGQTPVAISVRDGDNNVSTVQATFTVNAAGGGTTFYRDADGDGFGDPLSTVTTCTGAPTGYVSNDDDCNDADAGQNPATLWYRDTDGDGIGNAADGLLQQCPAPFGFTRVGGDNCTTIPNPDQADANANGSGDACEYARGDLNLDGIVNAADVPLLLNHWGEVNPPIGDLDGNGFVNAADFARMLANWGTGPG